MLPDSPLRQMYDKLRHNPKWYLRKELVDDCIRKGGCCARSRGCCEKRHVGDNTRKGIGHCTLECECCAMDRRFEFGPKLKEFFWKQMLDMIRGPTLSYLITIHGWSRPCSRSSNRPSHLKFKKSLRLGVSGYLDSSGGQGLRARSNDSLSHSNSKLKLFSLQSLLILYT